MATPAQILANRENAQHSTGPTTEEGKAVSAGNAVRHSLTARGLIVPLGLETAFADFEAALRINLIPNGGLEGVIFQRILESGWNLERCRRAQAQLFEKTAAADLSIDPLLDDQNEAKFARIDKYARQSENSMFKAMRELSKIQTEAQFRNEIHPLNQEEIDNPELFDRTPQSLSAICDFQQVMAAASACRTPKDKPNFQNKADSERAALAFLEQITAPPPQRSEDFSKMIAKLRTEAA